MKSQKGISAVVVILIIVLVLAAGAGVWYYFWNKSRSEPETTTEEEPETTTRSSNLKTGTLEVGSEKVTFSYPQSWGDFVKPTVDRSMRMITSGPYKDRGFAISFLGEDTQDSTQGKNFLEFPYIETKTSRTPYGYLIIYPEEFRNDQNEEMRDFWITKAEKDAVVDPMVRIYNNETLTGVSVLQNVQTGGSVSPLENGWWGNRQMYSDRIEPKYLKNDANNFRGTGYFDVTWKEMTSFNPAYAVALINPQKRAVVLFYLPLDTVPDIVQFRNADIDFTQPNAEELAKDYMNSGYSYLSSPSKYATTELGDFLSEVEEMVKSMTIN